jgi:hypothetical protein
MAPFLPWFASSAVAASARSAVADGCWCCASVRCRSCVFFNIVERCLLSLASTCFSEQLGGASPEQNTCVIA